MSFFRRSAGGSTKLVELGSNIVISASDNTSPYNASATYQINANAGTYTRTEVGTPISNSSTVKWAIRGDNSTYYVRGTKIAGPDNPDVGSPANNTWLQTNTNRTWTLSIASAISVDCTLLIEISNKSDGSVILDSHEVALSATGTGP